ncbi:cysteine--tRNA ligase [Patescibacteria group bacterium]|nr:cysteine--tRNA ligase [Patescibacteria group bacterium]MBU1722051.1 cysteine--tRNA ligase [Patescibacteria group bacterium]MBU1901521.1 cysteine--tRNA ligase [Patescibacteria group bacterium]
MTLSLYNSLTKQKEEFTPIHDHEVSLYACGPTVYHYAHIGNLRTYVFEDILRRALRFNGYKVKHVMNITDVGHLTDDADDGEDKMEKGSQREGKTAWEIAEFYTDAFKHDIALLDILEPSIWAKATDHIDEQIVLVQTLLDKGFAYQTNEGIYFDTTKVKDYGKLVDLHKQELQAGARVDLGEKKNPHDFALWKFTKEEESRQMEWDAFFKKGFPGWHVECSAMSMKYLGDHFDIHCGGIDHKPVHHTNEIAQTEAATGKKPWVNVWMHGEWLIVDEGKMSKSTGDFITLQTLVEKGYDPLAYRYYLLQAHYRKQINFSFEALDAAAQGLKKLRQHVNKLTPSTNVDPHIRELFNNAINDDLNTPEALAILWTAIKEGSIDLNMLVEFDKVLGLHLHQPEKDIGISEDIQTLVDARAQARTDKNWADSDKLRDEIFAKGYIVEDTADGQKVFAK